MWNMECREEVKVGPNNSIDSDCTSAKMTRPSIFKHLALPAGGGGGGGRLQSSRWSPTAEQLMMLEELYKHGTRTPTALQIQEITAKLRRFGKIEGKNVFYWFQNHKARDKKKQRLRLEAQRRLFDHHKPPVIAKATTLEAQHTKHEPLSNCSNISEECGSVVGRVTTRSRAFKHEATPFCFPMINLNGTRPSTIISLLDTPHHDHHHDYSPRFSHVISNIFGNSNDYGTIRETLNLFPLQSGNLKAFSQMQTANRHEDAMPFTGDLSLSSLLVPLET